MKTKTGGIIATLATLLLCGAPGLILFLMGAAGIITSAPSDTRDNVATADFPTFLVLICGGILLMLIPPVVAFFTLRRKSTPFPVQPTAAYTPIPAYQSSAPVVTANQINIGGMDVSTQAVYDRIMALNRPTAPYQIIDGKAKGVDLIAEWKIVDARWYEIFAKASLTKVFRIYMKFDPGNREVRTMDEELNVSWRAGVPSFSAEASFFRGQKSSFSFGTGYAFTENLAPGQVYNYKFSTHELKKPIQDAIAACGWTYKGVTFGKL
ncbi:MAG: hypothetical protein Q7J80_00920 [Anaerolineales bacterium]|nr:hypothetical protein [Anaerolineales bacterium]